MTALLDLLETSKVVTIALATSKGNVIETPVGVVVVGDAGYVRSQSGSKGKWYQRAIRRQTGFVVDGTRRFPVVFERVTDAETIRRTDAATYRKYGGGLRSVLLRPLLWKTRMCVMRMTPVPARAPGQ